MRRAHLLLLLLASCKGFSVTPPAPSPDPIEHDDAFQDAASPCGRACKALHALGCPEGEPSPGGVSCYAVCTRAGAAVNPTCVAAARTLQDVHACNVRCEP